MHLYHVYYFKWQKLRTAIFVGDRVNSICFDVIKSNEIPHKKTDSIESAY